MSAQTSNAGQAGGTFPLTDEQRAIVRAPDGPMVVLAGAGTGKTRVIVERVRWLLETKGEVTGEDGRLVAGEPAPRHGNPFDGPLVPEQMLVLTYNVKAGRELQDRLDKTVGPAVRARMQVSNFHSFCHHVLAESAADADLPAQPDVLDGVGQLLLLQSIRGELDLRYHKDGSLPDFVNFINRCKDELVTAADFDAFLREDVGVFEAQYGPWEPYREDLLTSGRLGPLREVQGEYRKAREQARRAALGLADRADRADRAEGEDQGPGDKELAEAELWPVDAPKQIRMTAYKAARKETWGTGAWIARKKRTEEEWAPVDALAAEYIQDGAVLELVRLEEFSRVYHLYQETIAARGVLDFGEQIALLITVFDQRPNVLRRWQRQYRYIMVDEFQDANVAQIGLLERLGRTPDRPDNVMVVGDDDQSIYRFRGASFAAFDEFARRFSAPPVLRLEQNFRSVPHVVTAANRLIAQNQLRFAPDKRLIANRAGGAAVQIHTCASRQDEAVAILEVVKALAGPGNTNLRPDGQPVTYSDVAVLYRMHKHNQDIVKLLEAEEIPYTVVGGHSLFETPEIRDLEQGLRAIANPHDDAAVVRMMTAGPWRLDALEILRVARDAKVDDSRLVDAAARMVASGEAQADVTPAGTGPVVAAAAADDEAAADTEDEADAEPEPSAEPEPAAAPAERKPDRRTRTVSLAPETRTRLRLLLEAIGELNPQTWRDGPFTIMERYLERTSQLLDLLAAGTADAMRAVVNIASFMRFVSDWQAEHPTRSLQDFCQYLDAYQQAGGSLNTSVDLVEEAKGVRLMTLYQAKGLEFPIVVIPGLQEDAWPTKERADRLFPRELLKQQVPEGDIHIDEERRLLYVAMTRAQDHLMLTTQGGRPDDKGGKPPSRFIEELLTGHGAELTPIDRVGGTGADVGIDAALELAEDVEADEEAEGAEGAEAAAEAEAQAKTPEEIAREELLAKLVVARKIMPLPSVRERRLELRLRAAELVGMLEASAPDHPEADGARDGFADSLLDVGRSAVMTADEARAAGLDPLTFRTVALDSGAGANLLEIAPLPPRFSYSSFSTFEKCPFQYALTYVYQIPEPDKPKGALTFGLTAHAAFEAYTKLGRERVARGEPAPTREDLNDIFRAQWVPGSFGDRTDEDRYRRRAQTMLDAFWDRELKEKGRTEKEELGFAIVLEPSDGSAAVRITGSIDRIDRLETGNVEVIDYKTGSPGSQGSLDKNLQLTIYALACRDALDLGTPERVTLFFTELGERRSTVRTDADLDAAREELLLRAAQIRTGNFIATPGGHCTWCNYRALCSERKVGGW